MSTRMWPLSCACVACPLHCNRWGSCPGFPLGAQDSLLSLPWSWLCCSWTCCDQLCQIHVTSNFPIWKEKKVVIDFLASRVVICWQLKLSFTVSTRRQLNAIMFVRGKGFLNTFQWTSHIPRFHKSELLVWACLLYYLFSSRLPHCRQEPAVFPHCPFQRHSGRASTLLPCASRHLRRAPAASQHMPRDLDANNRNEF